MVTTRLRPLSPCLCTHGAGGGKHRLSGARFTRPCQVPPLRGPLFFAVCVRQTLAMAMVMAMAHQPNARQFVAMRMMSVCTVSSRPQTDETIRSSIHVDMAHARISHGAARVVGREPAHDRSLAARRGVEIDRSPVAMHRGMIGTCNHGARPARRDNLHRAKLGLDPV